MLGSGAGRLGRAVGGLEVALWTLQTSDARSDGSDGASPPQNPQQLSPVPPLFDPTEVGLADTSRLGALPTWNQQHWQAVC